MPVTSNLKKRPRAQLNLEYLEDRLVPAGVEPTAVEQLFLEQLNDARANPAAYGNSIGLDLSGVAASQPLAWDPRLIAAARGHSQDMNDRNFFDHTNPSGQNPGARITAQGYSFTSWGESIAAGFANTGEALKALIIDDGIPDLGHRKHLLAIDSIFKNQSQVGIGVVLGGSGYYSNYYTIDTAAPSTNKPFITGVVYNDLNKNGKYDIGEGLGGVTVTVQGVGSVTTYASGGYQIQVNAGTYNVTASGGGLIGGFSSTVTVGSSNQRVTIVQGASQAAQDANNQFVKDLYQSFLMRQAGATEVSTFGGYLNNGQATRESLTNMIKTSQEYANVNSIWLKQAYSDMLGRQIGAGETTSWVTWLKGPGTRGDVAQAILTSQEYNVRQWTGWVQTAYQTYLHRSAGSSEVAAWVNNFQVGWAKNSVTQSVLASAEYQNQFGSSDSLFVAALYTEVLGRKGSSGEVTGWVNLLKGSLNRAQVIAGFLASGEYATRVNSQWSSQLYLSCLGRQADNNEIYALVNALKNGASQTSLGVNVLLSQEYYNRAFANY